MSPKSTVPYKFILFVFLFFIADFTLDNINHRFLMPDFKVYCGAAHAIMCGKQVYGNLFSLGSGYYKYAPFTALIFYPLSVLPYYMACVVFYVLIATAIVLTTIFLLHFFSAYVFKLPVKFPNTILSLSILCIAIHIIREIGLGNVNMFLLMLLCLVVYFIIQNKMLPAGVLLALVLVTKPFFIVVLIPLLMRRYFKAVFITVLLLLLLVILPALLLGIHYDVELHSQWLNTMLMHADGYPSPNTIEAISRNIHPSNVSGNLQYVLMALFLVFYVFYIRANRMNEKKDSIESPSNFIMEWFTLIAMIPCLFKTDTEHFLMSLPIIMFILIYLFNNRNVVLTVSFILFILLFAGNSSDLLGAKLSMEMFNIGTLGISNMLLVALALFIYTRRTSNRREIGLEP